MRTLAELTSDIRENNIEKGWRSPDGRPCQGHKPDDYFALLHSEISEALEAYRDHRLADATRPVCGQAVGGNEPCPERGPSKPEGVGSELADCVIRLLDMCDAHRWGAFDLSGTLGDFPRRGDLPLEVYGFGTLIMVLHAQVTFAYGARGTINLPERLHMILSLLCAVADLCEIDLNAEVERKIAYNRTRPYQHGGRSLTDAP